MILLFVSCNVTLARFAAMMPQVAYLLPRCGVPAKMTSLVLELQFSDLRIA